MLPDPCATPSEIAPKTGRIGQLEQESLGLFQRLIRTDQPEEVRRALMWIAGCTLCFCLVVLTLAVWYQACLDQHVDGGLVGALGIISGSVAGLAGVSYHKQGGPNGD